MLANIERFVIRIRMVAQQIIQFDENPANEKPMIFNPDQDGFEFGLKDAILIHNYMNMLQFIRRNLGISGIEKTSKGRQFDMGVEHLEARFKEDLEITSMKITI